jgi:diguanylate cyclase (GGDEF)-like protein
VSVSLHSLRKDKRVMAHSAAAMYGVAALDGLITDLIPGDPSTTMGAVLIAFALAALIALVGPRLPRWALAPIGAAGVVVIGYGLAAGPGITDGAVLYLWPVLWTAFFFGRRGCVAIVICVAVVHGVAVLSLPANTSYAGRWVNVVISAAMVAAVVQMLGRRNEQLLAQLAGEARTDELTGLLNRRGLEERVSLEFARARRDGSPIAVAALDIDHFKQVNDEWGHAVGDRVVARVGRVLATLSRDLDIAARIGGDEFVVVLPGSRSAEAEVFAGRIRSALAGPDGPGPAAVHVSIGIAIADAPATFEPLLRAADRALYMAKQAGRDRTMLDGAESGSALPSLVAGESLS